MAQIKAAAITLQAFCAHAHICIHIYMFITHTGGTAASGPDQGSSNHTASVLEGARAAAAFCEHAQGCCVDAVSVERQGGKGGVQIGPDQGSSNHTASVLERARATAAFREHAHNCCESTVSVEREGGKGGVYAAAWGSDCGTGEVCFVCRAYELLCVLNVCTQNTHTLVHTKHTYTHTHKYSYTQATWRMFVQRQRLQQQRAACIKVQSAWRGHCQRSVFAVTRARIVCLQAWVRGMRARKAAGAKRAAVVKVQVSV